MFRFWAGKDILAENIKVGNVPTLVLHSKDRKFDSGKRPGILWIHGGGYATGMKEMVYIGRAESLVRKYGAVVVAPDYRLSWMKPYPAALKDCYKVLMYMAAHAEELGFRKDQLMVGGESAGGGLTAALCMLAKDKGTVKIAYQMPLYPMLSNLDTISSSDNHGRIWNTRRNHMAWKLYLRNHAKEIVSPYASPSHRKNYEGLPPCYSFVGDGEPFYAETVQYIEDLKAAGVEAYLDVYHCDMHAFDMMKPKDGLSKEAIWRFEKHFEYAMEHYW